MRRSRTTGACPVVKASRAAAIDGGRSVRFMGRRNLEQPTPGAGFSLLEVMIAVGIFAIAVFAILDLTNQNLRAARLIVQYRTSDFMRLAAELTLTNRIEEGVVSGDFSPEYPNVSWTREIRQVRTNGLFQVDFSVTEILEVSRSRPVLKETKSSILVYRPESAVSLPGGVR